MITISAFADEIDPDPQKQIDLLKQCQVNHIELRSILETNVLALSELQLQELKSLLAKEGFRLSAIGSPIGKIGITEPFTPHLEKFKHALELCNFFETPNMRIFSYYQAEDGEWSQYRQEVMDRMAQKIQLAEKAGVRLLHENEHRIYGDTPERVKDLMETLAESPSFGAVYDPANYVVGGDDPVRAWEMTRDFTVHFHVKDWKEGAKTGSIPGEGEGKIPEVIADAVQRNYQGFATMEPHLLEGGSFGGKTGPDLFAKAINAFKKILDAAGARYQ